MTRTDINCIICGASIYDRVASYGFSVHVTTCAMCDSVVRDDWRKRGPLTGAEQSLARGEREFPNPPKLKTLDADTAKQIDDWFREGVQAHRDGTSPECPYGQAGDDDSLARHWWTRGFAYSARLHRAIEAEKA